MNSDHRNRDKLPLVAFYWKNCNGQQIKGTIIIINIERKKNLIMIMHNLKQKTLLCLYRHKYGTMVKTNILYRKLWNFNLLWEKKPWHNEKNGTTVGHSIFLLVLIIRN